MAWWESMPKAVQAWLTIGGVVAGLVGGAFALGAATRETVVGHRDLPDRVSNLESHDARQDTALAYLMRIDSQRVRVWQGFEETSEAVAEMQCIMRADVRGEDRSSCLPTLGGPRR